MGCLGASENTPLCPPGIHPEAARASPWRPPGSLRRAQDSNCSPSTGEGTLQANGGQGHLCSGGISLGPELLGTSQLTSSTPIGKGLLDRGTSLRGKHTANTQRPQESRSLTWQQDAGMGNRVSEHGVPASARPSLMALDKAPHPSRSWFSDPCTGGSTHPQCLEQGN